MTSGMESGRGGRTKGVIVDSLLQLAVVGVAMSGALFAIKSMHRVTMSGDSGFFCPLPPGVTVVTRPECEDCEETVAPLRSAFGDSLNVLEGPQALLDSLDVTAVPTVFVVDKKSRIVMRRSGRAARVDVDRITAAAAA